MGYTPPNPGRVSSLVTAALNSTYDMSASAFRGGDGLLRFPVIAQGTGAIEWQVDLASTTCPLLLISDTTYQVLRSGTLNGEQITYRGTTYKVQAVRHGDGSQWVELAQV